MLSVILYGRNDNYGYNLHKRAALSINCISELLSDEDDELIFVDYNTPDDLPTFPEAIQDTLTEHAWQKLRILRVRPFVHERFRPLTHLIALEPISRNIALRRSNPDNRWILSTNTDMLFVPRSKKSLSEILQQLPDGLYHLPRFEIPETLWETFNRSNPKEVIDAVRDWGTTARLNEIVYGSDDILYDGPGDFQLAPRKVYFELDGFDERMLLGWHVDSNMAKRLALKLGSPRSFIDHIFGYHCDHTRMATPAHRRDRIENDSVRFVTDIKSPEIPEQANDWGCPNDHIEEIRLLPGDTAYARALRRNINPLQSATTEAYYREESYDNLWYDLGHVLPFALDLLNSAPRDWNIAWVGCRPAALAYFANCWEALGFTGAIFVSQNCQNLADALTSSSNSLEFCDDQSILRNANAFVFEVGLPSHDRARGEVGRRSAELSDRDLLRFQIVRRAFLNYVAHERECLQLGTREPRRFIFINAIHNRFEELVTKHIGITFTPYSSRTRHGFVYADTLDAAGSKEISALSNSERRRLVDLVNRAVEFGPKSDLNWARAAAVADPLLDLTARPDACAIFSRRPDELANIIEVISRHRFSASLVPSEPFEVTDLLPAPHDRSLSRAAEYHDWDSPKWIRGIEALLDSPRPQAWYSRSAWLWERAQTLFGLSELGCLRSTSKALIAAVAPDRLIGALSEALAQLDILPLAASSPGKMIGGWTDKWHVDPTRVQVFDFGKSFSDLPNASYDIVLMPHTSIYLRGSLGFVQFLASAAKVLKPNGIFTFSAELLLSDKESAGEPHWLAPIHQTFWNAVRETCGLDLLGPFDGRLSKATVDRVWESDRPTPGVNYFVGRSDRGEHLISSLWFLRKARTREASAAELLDLRRLGLETSAELWSTSVPLPAEPPLRPTQREVNYFSSLVATVAKPSPDDSAVDHASFLAEPILRLLNNSEFIELSGLESPSLAAVRALIENSRISTTFPLRSDFQMVDIPGSPDERPLSKAAEYFDWDYLEWRRWASGLSDNRRPSDVAARTSWIWEKTQFLYGLARLGLLDQRRHALAVTVLPDRLLGVLADHMDSIDCLPLSAPERRLDGAYWADGWLLRRDHVSVLDTPDFDRLPPVTYDVVLFPHSSICLRGPDGFAHFLAQASRLLKPGGYLVFSADLKLNSSLTGSWTVDPSGDLWPTVRDTLNLELENFDRRISRATLDRSDGNSTSNSPFNVLQPDGAYLSKALWFLQRLPGDITVDPNTLRKLSRMAASTVNVRGESVLGSSPAEVQKLKALVGRAIRTIRKRYLFWHK